jgi:hypothetical protein
MPTSVAEWGADFAGIERNAVPLTAGEQLAKQPLRTANSLNPGEYLDLLIGPGIIIATASPSLFGAKEF